MPFYVANSIFNIASNDIGNIFFGNVFIFTFCTVKGNAKEAGGKTISKSGQDWTLPALLGQLKTGQDGKGLLRIHLWCPDDLPRLWDRVE